MTELILPAIRKLTSVDDTVTITDPTGPTADLSTSAGPGGSGIEFHTGTYGAENTGDWLHVTVTGLDADDLGAKFTDTGEGGFNFFTDGFGGNGGGVYLQADPVSPLSGGNPRALQLQMNGTDVESPAIVTGLRADAEIASGNGTVQGGYLTASGIDGPAVGLQAGGSNVTNAATGNATGLYGTGDVSNGATGAAVGVQAEADAQSGGVTHDATAFLGTAKQFNALGGTGTAYGLDILADTTTPTAAAPAIGGRLHATSKNGDATGLIVIAEASGTGTVYGLRVFNGAQEIFRVNGDGSLQGRTGKSLVFNL